MKKQIIALTVFALFMLQTAVSLASNQTWYDKKYDFAAARTIYLYEPEFAQNVAMPEQITQLQMKDEFVERSSKLRDVKILEDAAIKSMMLRYTLVDYDAIAATDSEGAAAAFAKGVATFVKLKIKPVIRRYDVTKEWREPYTYTTTEYEDITIKKDGKETTISVPHTEEHYVEGHYEYTQNIKVEFSVYSAADDKLVFTYVDTRAADKDGIDMYRRMVDSFYNKLKKVL